MVCILLALFTFDLFWRVPPLTLSSDLNIFLMLKNPQKFSYPLSTETSFSFPMSHCRSSIGRGEGLLLLYTLLAIFFLSVRWMRNFSWNLTRTYGRSKVLTEEMALPKGALSSGASLQFPGSLFMLFKCSYYYRYYFLSLLSIVYRFLMWDIRHCCPVVVFNCYALFLNVM